MLFYVNIYKIFELCEYSSVNIEIESSKSNLVFLDQALLLLVDSMC